jgi:hypothetical protein
MRYVGMTHPAMALSGHGLLHRICPQFAPWRKSTGTRCNALWRGKARKWELT